MAKFLLLILVYIATTALSFAQIDLTEYKQPYSISPFPFNEELKSSRIVTVNQCSRGFIWIGTMDGLIKYDGKSATHYIKNDTSSNILPGIVLDILPNPDGTLWVVTPYEGLLKYYPEWDKFESFEDTSKPGNISNEDYRSIFRDSQERVWVGTVNTGLFLLDEVNNSLIPVTNSNEFSTDDVFFIEEGKDGELLLDTGIPGVIVFYNPETKGFKKFKFSEEGVQRETYGISNTILYDSDGDIWIGTFGFGLYQIKNGEVIQYEEDILGTDVVSGLLQDNKGMIWVATDGSGLVQFDKKTFPYKVTTIKHNPQNIKSLVSNGLRSIYEGEDGLIWVGTYSNGLSIINNNSHGVAHLKNDPNDISTISNNDIRSIKEDKQGNIWVGTSGGGLNKLNDDFSFTRIKHDPENNNSLVGDAIVDIVEDSLGDLWLGSFGDGFSIFSPGTHSFKNYMDGKGELTKQSVWSTLHDNEGNTWIGTLSGLYYFDKDKDEFIEYRNVGDSNFENIAVTTLFQDSENIVWVGTIQNGIAQLNREEKIVTSYSFERKELVEMNRKFIRSFYEDTQHRLWVATEGGLLLLKGEGAPKLYNGKDGLPSNKLMGMLEDDHRNLWISTHGGGLSKFNPTTEEFRNYDERTGLQSMSFSKKAYFKTSNGLMMFGSENGLNIFHPDSIKLDTDFPEVTFTGFKIFDKEVPIGKEMSKHINLAKTINLDHNQNIISIDFSAIKFTDQKSIYYSYQLEGFDEDWRLSPKGNIATYTNLESGTYTFKVKASNNQNEWGSSTYNLIINIKPPWWKTWWFRGVLLLIIVLLYMIIDKFRVSIYKSRKIELETIVSKRTVELKKSYDTVQQQNDKIQYMNECLEEKATGLTEANQSLLLKNKEIAKQSEQIEQTFLKLQNTQSQLIQSEKMASIGQLTAGIAHEINNPINFITAGTTALALDMEDLMKFIGYADKIKDDKLQKIKDEIDFDFITENIHQTIKDIRQGGNRTAEIVKELRTFSHLDDSGFNPTDIHNGIESTLVLLQSKLKNNITLEKKYLLKDKIDCSPGQINQVLMNILTNAIHAIKGMGHIIITTKDEGEYALISIKDSGPGIPMKIRKKIFDPFFTTKDVGEGTGLGLSISYGIIEKHKGEIDFKCEDGCEFIIKLPKKQYELADKAKSKPKEVNQEQS